MKRRLVPVEVDGPLPAPGTPVLRKGTEAAPCALAVSGAAWPCCAWTRCMTALTCGDARLIPRIPAWMRLPEPAA